MNIEQFRQQETIRFLNWISENKVIWDKMCGSTQEPLTNDEYLHYFSLLKEQKFYDILMMLISRNQETISTVNFFESLGVKKLAELWDDNILEYIESYLKNEINNANEQIICIEK